jgi:hypothetical protein
MFPQCAPANLETICLLEIGDISRKLRLLCSCQFPWCALALRERTLESGLQRLPSQWVGSANVFAVPLPSNVSATRCTILAFVHHVRKAEWNVEQAGFYLHLNIGYVD